MIINVIDRYGNISSIRPGKRNNKDIPPDQPPKQPKVYNYERPVIAVSVIRSAPIVQFLRHDQTTSVQTMVIRMLQNWRNDYRFIPNSRTSLVDGTLLRRNTDNTISTFNCDIKYINDSSYEVYIPRGTILIVHANKPQIEAGLFLVAINDSDHFRVYLCELSQSKTSTSHRKASTKTREFQST